MFFKHALAIGSLVKYIIVNSIKYVNYLRSFSHAGRQKMKGRSYMPTYKDEKTGTWFVKCYYTDYIGNKKQKKKRGFARQKDAKEWVTVRFIRAGQTILKNGSKITMRGGARNTQKRAVRLCLFIRKNFRQSRKR